MALPHPINRPSGAITVSAGVAESSTADPLAADEWLRRADVALYQAKGGGRNRVVAFERAAAAA
jgi:two-component system cell cycle response regulator